MYIVHAIVFLVNALLSSEGLRPDKHWAFLANPVAFDPRNDPRTPEKLQILENRSSPPSQNNSGIIVTLMLNCKINGTVHIFFLKKSYLSPHNQHLNLAGKFRKVGFFAPGGLWKWGQGKFSQNLVFDKFAFSLNIAVLMHPNGPKCIRNE